MEKNEINTVEDFIKQNTEKILHLMTPSGYIDLLPEQNKQLLTSDESFTTNPGCSGADMTVPAKYILSQHIFSCRINQATNQCYIITY